MKFVSCWTVWIFCVKYTCLLADIADPVVNIQQGYVRGRFLNMLQGRGFYAFTGIPFAKPPVGNLRFKPPQAAEPWNGTFNATTVAPMCPQMFNFIIFAGDENCLTLNVFCHSLISKKTLLPVLVYIHGGGFQYGSASMIDFPPNRLMSHKNIVLVTIQYRLNSLGFLSTGDSASPGNYGLLDQIEALRWVQKNIRKFGGDPRRVTLAGESAGGMSIGFHMVSPLAKGLFRGAVTMSGSPLMNIIVQKNPRPIANLVGNRVGCQSIDTFSLVNCLRSKSVKELTEATNPLVLLVFTSQIIPLGPVVENPVTGSYLLDDPEKLFQEGKFLKVPTMAGTTKDEGASTILFFPSLQYLKLTPVLTDAMIDHVFNELLPPIFRLTLNYENNLLNLSQAARREYSDEYNFTDTKQLFQCLIDMGTDATFRAGHDKFARLVARKVNTYIYSFDYHGDFFTSPTNFGDKEVDHAVSLAYYKLPAIISERDSIMSDILVTHLLNFVKTLNPNQRGSKLPKWTTTPYSNPLRYLRYGDAGLDMKTGFYQDKMEFWNKEAPKIVS